MPGLAQFELRQRAADQQKAYAQKARMERRAYRKERRKGFREDLGEVLRDDLSRIYAPIKKRQAARRQASVARREVRNVARSQAAVARKGRRANRKSGVRNTGGLMLINRPNQATGSARRWLRSLPDLPNGAPSPTSGKPVIGPAGPGALGLRPRPTPGQSMR